VPLEMQGRSLLRGNPAELTNLAGFTSHQAIAKELRARLITRMVEVGEPAPVRTTGQRRVDPTVRTWEVRPIRFGHQ
jgi:hypothetical protein